MIMEKKSARYTTRKSILLKSLGTRVRALRTKQRWSQQVLAKNAGLSPRFIAQLESGQSNISISKLDNVAEALGCPLINLIRFERMDSVSTITSDDKLLGEIVSMLEGKTEAELFAVRRHLVAGSAGNTSGVPNIITLLGLPGTGKTSIGKEAARSLRRKFLSLDELVVEESGFSIPEIIEIHGERRLRKLEFEVLLKLVENKERIVLEVPPGAVTNTDTFTILHTCTLPVFLKTRPEELFKRAFSEKSRWATADKVKALDNLRQAQQERQVLFGRARITVDTTAKTPEACFRQLMQEIKQLK